MHKYPHYKRFPNKVLFFSYLQTKSIVGFKSIAGCFKNIVVKKGTVSWN